MWGILPIQVGVTNSTSNSEEGADRARRDDVGEDDRRDHDDQEADDDGQAAEVGADGEDQAFHSANRGSVGRVDRRSSAARGAPIGGGSLRGGRTVPVGRPPQVPTAGATGRAAPPGPAG